MAESGNYFVENGSRNQKKKPEGDGNVLGVE